MGSDFFSHNLNILWVVLAMLCLAYSLMIYMIGSGTFSYLIWLGGALFFGICFFLSENGRWAEVPAGIRYASYVFLAITAVVFLVCQVAILSHFSDKGENDLDYIIVLGAQMRDSGPSPAYRYRLERTKEYLDLNNGTLCITTGGKGSNEPVSEGAGGMDYLISHGISPDRITAETKSADTAQNIQNAFKIIEEKEGNTDNLKIGIVTNGFHVFRGVHIARGLTQAKICGIAAYMQPQYIPNNVARETFGVLRDFMAGRLKF